MQISKVVFVGWLLFAAVYSENAQSVVCSAESIELTSQAEVNGFQENYGDVNNPCDEVLINLRITGDDIDDLNPLSAIRSVGNSLAISQNKILNDLSGLSDLAYVGEHLWISRNDSLSDISALSNLQGHFDLALYILKNKSLTNVDGLSGITIAHHINIESNEALANIDALSELSRTVGPIYISGNPLITDLIGLSNLTEVGAILSIVGNESLQSLDGLSKLITIGRTLQVSSNPNLLDVDGLSALSSVNDLDISNNPSLTNIDGLSALTTVRSFLSIGANASLANLDGLSNLRYARGIEISGNTSLSNVNGLSTLTENIWYFTVSNNPNLLNLNGLRNLSELRGNLDVSNNNKLINIDGLSALIRVEGDVSLIHNLQLSDCSGVRVLLDDVDDGDPGPGPGGAGIPDIGGYVSIGDNLDGCNSISEILSDVGTFTINPGLNDAWFNPLTNGQGVLISVFPESSSVFLAWFTYDTDLPPDEAIANLGDPGHRWLTAQGTYADNKAVMDIVLTSGGLFDSPSEVSRTDPPGSDGTLILTLDDCYTGTIEYDIPSIDRQGTVPIQRIVNDNVPLCEELDSPDMVLPDSDPENPILFGLEDDMNPGLNDAWFNPETNGQGILVSVLPESKVVFLAWFTYDTELPPEGISTNLGDPGHRWLTAQGTFTGAEANMDLVITSGGLFDTPIEVERTDPPGSDGTIMLKFEDCNSGVIEYNIPSIDRQGTVPIQRIVTDNVPLCEALIEQ